MKYTDNALDEIVNLEREVFSLKAQNAILLKKYKMAQRDASTQDRLVEYNNLVVDSIPFLANISLSQPTAPSISDPEEAVLVCSCWHIGEVVKANDMGGMNEYNMDIFVRRLQQLVDKTVGIVAPLQKSRGLKTLHLIHTGDAVGGIIHSELTESNDLNIVEQAHLGALVTAQAILELRHYFSNISFTGVIGNHGRIKEERYFKNKAQVNWDYVFYNTLATLLQNFPEIVFNIPLSYWTDIDILSWKFLIQHGDSMGRGNLYNTLQRSTAKWRDILAVQGKHFNYFISSHYHTRA